MDINFHLNIGASGYKDDKIFVLVLGTAVDLKANKPPVANGDFSYLDFSTGKLKPTPPGFKKVTDTMVHSLNQFKTDAKGNYIVTVPHIGTARLYISFGKSLTEIPTFVSSGPVNGKDNKVIYDKIEFDNAAHKEASGTINAPNPNVNLTSVDFYGLSFTITAYDINISKDRTIGYETSRNDMVTAFNAIPTVTGTDGNPSFMKALVLKDGDNLIRILAPKSASASDLGATNGEMVTQAVHRTHFWRDYVNNKCYKPNRQFTCYSKLYNSTTPGNIYYGEIDSKGLNLNLYTDPERTKPYLPCTTLPRPSNKGNLPDFSNGFSGYNMLKNEPVDWGFLLSANTEGEAAPHWASDDVAMSILISICRGCMHMDEADDWVKSENWYTADGPIFYYSSILHEKAINNLAYAFSYDDIFGTDPSIYFKNHPNVTVKFGAV